jgi:cation diffusion facilitator CzcD-associated flavoprotein CzcO
MDSNRKLSSIPESPRSVKTLMAWIVNDPSYGRFDSVIAAIGTCGDPQMAHFPSQEKFKREIYHSSQLEEERKRQKVVVVGGGASAVEALEFVAAENAVHTNVLAQVS